MKVVVTAPDEYMGDVMGDINARRGQIVGSDIRNGTAIVTANVPLSTMFGYATDLRSKTQGRATYSMEPSHLSSCRRRFRRRSSTEATDLRTGHGL